KPKPTSATYTTLFRSVEAQTNPDALPHPRKQQQQRQDQPEDDVLGRDRCPVQKRVPTETPGSKRKWVAALGPGFVASSIAAPGESWTGPRSKAAAAPNPAERTGDHCNVPARDVISPTIPSCQARIQYARKKGAAVTAKSGLTR